MNIQLDPSGTVDGLTHLIQQMSAEPGISGMLILAAGKNSFSPDAIDGILREAPLPVFGGIFPAIIHGREVLNQGTVVVGLTGEIEILTVSGLSDIERDYEEAVENFQVKDGSDRTMLIFVDGFAQRTSALLEAIYSVYGLQYTYLGGGAGTVSDSVLDMTPNPCLFSNSGLLRDSAVIVTIAGGCGLGVNHGWEKISGPYKVTESKGNVIVSLDWQPAFAFYRRIIKESGGPDITTENFFEVAKYFPLGMSRIGSEIIVRDPFAVEGDALILATGIPQESFIDVLTGDPASLIQAAGKSLEEARQTFPGSVPQTVILIDCISRALLLGGDFPREIEAIYRPELPLIGWLSLGEIANGGTSYMELYNKTCVVGILGDA